MVRNNSQSPTPDSSKGNQSSQDKNRQNKQPKNALQDQDEQRQNLSKNDKTSQSGKDQFGKNKGL